MSALSPLNRAFNKIPKRAEKQESPQLHETFVDSGVLDVINTVDHQVIYGRRGTGKTHALSYLGSEAAANGDLSLYIDLRTIGSSGSLLNQETVSINERASRLLVDLLGQLHESIFNAVLEDSSLMEDAPFVEKADQLLTAITSIRIIGPIEKKDETESKTGSSASASAGVSLSPKGPNFSTQMGANASSEERGTQTETRTGTEQTSLNFTDVAKALNELGRTLSSRRVWLLLDEWISIPRDLQPYLAHFLTRCVLPVQKFTVKIAAIEQQSNFRAQVDGSVIGIELGADMAAHVNLDDFLVYEGNEERARSFFRGLFSKHVQSIKATTPQLASSLPDGDLISPGFTDKRAFDELVRAAEGVPRDALYIAAKAAMKAGKEKISVPLIRDSTRDWYHGDKMNSIMSLNRGHQLLEWIISEVIRGKRARAFLVKTSDSRNELLLALFDARVLHIIRRGYSAQDKPGERYDIWGIDYGAYVDLLKTNSAPLGMLPFEDLEGESSYINIDVPLQDHRAIRRAILDLDEFNISNA
ncbi:ORC-CDC6 family AAA ATPase [Nocardiopsis sp. LDBS1602]|uniref:ORC-CDC6 family AAA ATPase n=1 Tax=Nocardiopsis sp. LDBS1602 TaxID=3109597 RepID=UPI002DB72EF8|nr:hypothetical protein [Nocardiopsis sp. LDBS1602]MEC3891832.1 hypothetical protein [Nocardiopsis sp. LDBS1602]